MIDEIKERALSTQVRLFLRHAAVDKYTVPILAAPPSHKRTPTCTPSAPPPPFLKPPPHLPVLRPHKVGKSLRLHVVVRPIRV